MNKNTKVLLALIVLGVCVTTIYIYKKNKIPAVAENTIRLCFIRNTEDGGHANMYMDISGDGDKVSGEFDYFPIEKASKAGKFEGRISPVDKMMMARTLDVLWYIKSEGVTKIEELRVIMGEGTANPGFGEMKDSGEEGVFVYANPEKINYRDLPLSDVDCKTEYPF